MSNLNPELIDAEPVLDAQEGTDPDLEEIVDDLLGLGRMWAKHGITIGKMALKSSATTLEVTSGVLDKLARRVS
jgi:hypothetical protein